MSPANYAGKLRAALKKGEILPEEDMQWLDKYQSMHKRGRKPAGRPVLEAPSEMEASPEPIHSEGAPPPIDIPDQGNDGAGAPPPIDVSAPEPPPGGTGPKDGGAPASSAKQEETRKENNAEHSATCMAVAKAWGKWMVEMNHELAKAGSPNIPTGIITEMLVPCAYRAAFRFMPQVNNVYLDAGVVVLSSVGTVVLKKKMEVEREKNPPARVFHMPAPKKEEAPPAPSPPPVYPSGDFSELEKIISTPSDA